MARTLPDGCGECGLSIVACDAEAWISGNACCGGCNHRGGEHE